MTKSLVGGRGKVIKAAVLACIEKDLAVCTQSAVAAKYGLSIHTVRAIDRARRRSPLVVKGVIKNIE